MAIPHAKPTEVVDIRPLGADVQRMQTTTLIKTDMLEVIRLVLPAGKEIPAHSVPGEITVQCLEGKIVFGSEKGGRELSAGNLLYLTGAAEHSVRAVDDSSVLVTILLKTRM